MKTARSSERQFWVGFKGGLGLPKIEGENKLEVKKLLQQQLIWANACILREGRDFRSSDESAIFFLLRTRERIWG